MAFLAIVAGTMLPFFVIRAVGQKLKDQDSGFSTFFACVCGFVLAYSLRGVMIAYFWG